MRLPTFFRPWLCLLLSIWFVNLLGSTARAHLTLSNGANHDGTIVPNGTNIWTLTANAGDSIVLRCGELSGTATFGPMIQLYGPSGALLSSSSHASDAYLAYRTTNGGTFNVTVSSAVAGQTGTYRLRFMQIPGAFIIPPGDEGGPLINGGTHEGTNSLGDEDIWTFVANAGDNIVLQGGIVSGTPSYSPWLRLFGPDGVPQVSTSGGLGGMIEYQPTNSGTFAVLVGSRFAGNSGA